MKSMKDEIIINEEQQTQAKREMQAELIREGLGLEDLAEALGMSMRTLRRRFTDGSWEVKEMLIAEKLLPRVTEHEMLMIMAPWHNPFTPEIDEGYERAKAEALSEQVIDYWIPDEDEEPDPPYDYSGEITPFDSEAWERENLKTTAL